MYALLKGYKFNVGKIIESSIRSFQKNVKRGLIPHPAMITRPMVSPLTLTGVLKDLKNKKRKEMEIVEVAERPDEKENEELEMGQIPEESQLPTEEEMQNRRSPILHSPLKVRGTFSEPAECSRSNQGNAEIMEMLVIMKKEMEEREKRWEQQHKIRKEFLEVDFRKREQQWEQLLK